jgi:hypothetical protein
MSDSAVSDRLTYGEREILLGAETLLVVADVTIVLVTVAVEACAVVATVTK